MKRPDIGDVLLVFRVYIVQVSAVGIGSTVIRHLRAASIEVKIDAVDNAGAIDVHDGIARSPYDLFGVAVAELGIVGHITARNISGRQLDACSRQRLGAVGCLGLVHAGFVRVFHPNGHSITNLIGRPHCVQSHRIVDRRIEIELAAVRLR